MNTLSYPAHHSQMVPPMLLDASVIVLRASQTAITSAASEQSYITRRGPLQNRNMEAHLCCLEQSSAPKSHTVFLLIFLQTCLIKTATSTAKTTEKPHFEQLIISALSGVKELGCSKKKKVKVLIKIAQITSEWTYFPFVYIENTNNFSIII